MANIPGAAQAANIGKKERPFLRLLLKGADGRIAYKNTDGKKVAEFEIAVWKNRSAKTGKDYASAKDSNGNKYTGFFKE